MPSGSAELSSFLRRIDRRLRLRSALSLCARVLLVGSALQAALALFGFAGASRAAAVILIGALGSAFFAGFGRADLVAAAAAADRRAHLHDLLKTTLELREEDPPSPWQSLLERRAVAALGALEPTPLVALDPPRHLWGSAALLALWSVLLVTGAPRPLLDAGALLAQAAGSARAAAGDAAESTDDLAADEEPPPALEPPDPEARSASAASSERSQAGELGEPGAKTGPQSETAADSELDGEDAHDADHEGTGDAGVMEERRRMTDGANGKPPADSPPAGGEPKDGEGEREQGAESQDGPTMREVSDEVVALDMPSKASPKGAPRTANADAQQQGAQVTARSNSASENAQMKPGGDQAASGTPGPSTAPQQGQGEVLGEASDLVVTLEEVLLQALQREPEMTETEIKPSRRAEEAPSASRPLRATADPDAAAERAGIALPYPLYARDAIRTYFAPEDEASPEPTQEQPQGGQH